MENSQETVQEKPSLKCPKCEYQWTYGGKSKWYVSCPRCRYSFRSPFYGQK